MKTPRNNKNRIRSAQQITRRSAIKKSAIAIGSILGVGIIPNADASPDDWLLNSSTGVPGANCNAKMLSVCSAHHPEDNGANCYSNFLTNMQSFKNGNLWASFDCDWWIGGYVTGATYTETNMLISACCDS